MGVFRQFPYSNFHEMNMDEIIKIVKNMLEEWAQYYAEWEAWKNQMNDDWSNYQEVMNEAWQNMQDFINNYFDNLDVQNEINNKIISMVNTGEFAEIVAPYIPPRVTEWLTAHITQPEGVVIDTSLTVAGACADAKATGDRIGKEQKNLENVGSVDFLNPSYYGNYIALNGGIGSVVDIDNPTANILFNSYVISCSEGDSFTLDVVGTTSARAYAWLDSDKKILFASGANEPINTTIVAPENASYLIINDNSNGIVYAGEPVLYRINKLKNEINSKIDYNINEIEAVLNVDLIDITYKEKYIALNGGIGSVVDIDNPTANILFNSYVISCSEGDSFTLDVVGTTSARAYAWLDSDKKILFASGANEPINTIIVAPENASYLIVNDYHSNGIVYKGIPVDTKINNVVSLLNTKVNSSGITKQINVNNVFNKNDATTGKYLGPDGYTEIENANYGHSDYIYIENAKITSFTGGTLTNILILYDINKNFIEYDVISAYIDAVLPSNTAYCRFNFGESSINNINMSITLTTNTIYKNQVLELQDPITLNVGTNETYTTLKDAVDVAETLATNEQVVNIVLSEGEYDALEGFDLTAQTVNFIGLTLPNNVNIIGNGDKDNIIISAELPVDMTPYAFSRNNVSTLNFWKNNSLKNVTVKAKNMRYAVHNDDYKVNAIEDAVENFVDCAFIYEALSSGVDYSTVSKVPFGTGMAKGRKMSFTRCLFETDETESKFASLFHNNTEQTKPCIVEFESCKFVGGWGGSIKVSSAGSEVTDVMELRGCKGGDIRFTKESVYTGTDSEFKLYGYGNSFTGYVYEGITENANDTEMML